MSAAIVPSAQLERILRDGWREITLGDVFDVCSSKRVLQEQWKASGVPFYRAREIVKLAEDGKVDNELFISEELYGEFKDKYGAPEPGDLMVSAVGTLGACYVVQPEDRFYFKDASVLRLKPKQPIFSRYIQHAFRTNAILDQVHAGSGSTVGTYTIERAKKTRLWLPPLPEQRRIAEILDKADALRAKRRAAIAKLDTLTQSVFLDMFGDPVTNPKEWPRVKFAEICQRVTVGVVVRPASHYRPTGVPALRSLNVKRGKIVLDDLVYFSEEDNETKLKKTRLKRGDVVLVRSGQPGTAAVVPPSLEGANAIDLLIATPDREKCDPAFICEFFNSSGGRALVISSERGQVQKHLNVGSLASALIPLPPIDQQKEFSHLLSALTHQLRLQLGSRVGLDGLFASLQLQAFTGMV